jgi:hypothetical protein
MWDFLQRLVNGAEWVNQFFSLIIAIIVIGICAWFFGSLFLGAIMEILGIGA